MKNVKHKFIQQLDKIHTSLKKLKSFIFFSNQNNLNFF